MEDKELYPEFRCDMCNRYQDCGCDLETGMCDKCSDTLRKTFYYKITQQELSKANDKLKKIDHFTENLEYGQASPYVLNTISKIIKGDD